MINLSEIEATAKAATPGPWTWDSGVIPPDGPGRFSDIWASGSQTIIASVNELRELRPTEGGANATHIAACSPETILAMVAAIRQALMLVTSASIGEPAEVVLPRLRAALQPFEPGSAP